MIEVKNLTKRYDGHLAVDHLSFTLEEGRIYGFLGPNGAGKSTTMNMLTGYLAPSEGTIKINGFDILEEPEEARKCMGYLPELPPLYMDMTVMEYLKFAAGLKKIPKAKRTEAIEQALEVSGTMDVKERLIRNLSKGYRQRVGLAQAVLGFPDIIILDEPTVGLDPIQMIEMRDTIRNLAKGHTVLLSSHILSEVSAICDHILIISHGKLIASDTPEGLAAMMEGSTTLKLTVKGTQQQLEQALASLSGADRISIEPISAETHTSCEAISAENHTSSETISAKNTSSSEAIFAENTSLSETIFAENTSSSEVLTAANDTAATESFVSAEIEYGKGKELREELFFLLCDAKLPIYSLEVINRSLEDIFLELTEDETNLDSFPEQETSTAKPSTPVQMQIQSDASETSPKDPEAKKEEL